MVAGEQPAAMQHGNAAPRGAPAAGLLLAPAGLLLAPARLLAPVGLLAPALRGARLLAAAAAILLLL